MLTTIVASGISIRFPARPEIFAYPSIIFLLLIDRLRAKWPKLVLFMPLVTFFFAILYGSGVLLGDILIIFLIAKQLFYDQGKIIKTQRFFYLASILSLILSVCNGYGFKSLFYIYYIKDISQIQGEWFGILRILSIVDVFKLPFSNPTFDTILMFQVLEYIIYPKELFKLASAIIKVNGIVIISSAFFYPLHDLP